MGHMTRARLRAQVRQARQDGNIVIGRSRILAATAGVFLFGLLLGASGGLLLGGGDSPKQQVAEAPTVLKTEQGPETSKPTGAQVSEDVPQTAGSTDPVQSNEQATVAERADQAPVTSQTPTANRAAPKPETGRTEPWRRYAVTPSVAPKGAPRVAIVIDDLGLNRPNAWDTMRLPGPLTLAFMTYAERLPEMTEAARAHGHELMVHVPMLPEDPHTDPGPKVLDPQLDHEELIARLDWDLSRFEGFVGINNHMGSAFTRDREGMRLVLQELKRRGLLFLDSRTIGDSVGDMLAADMGVPHAGRDIFLDNNPNPAAIRAQLAKLEAIAREHGSAIAIGHPYDSTIEVLSEWLPKLRERGFALVPISALAKTGERGSDLAELSDGQTTYPDRR